LDPRQGFALDISSLLGKFLKAHLFSTSKANLVTVENSSDPVVHMLQLLLIDAGVPQFVFHLGKRVFSAQLLVPQLE
jgi:hypothetical protein